MKYLFGGEGEGPYKNKTMTVDAKSVEFAVKKFILSVEYPERFVEQDIFAEYDREKNEYPVDEKKLAGLEKVTIPVFLRSEDEDGKTVYKKVSDVDYREVLTSDFDRLISDCIGQGQTVPLIEDGSESLDKKNELILSSLPVIKNNVDYRNVRNEINAKLAELERHKEEYERQLEILKEWMKSKYRVIEAIETYLGTHEDIVELIGGKERADELPLHIYQQKLYMDEEYGIVSEVLDRVDGAVDFDYHSLSLFDDWICRHFKMYMPHKKSICVFQVCRNRKSYGDVWEDFVMDGYNGITYFLIRNGENLYRIFSGIRVPSSVFPTLKETDEIYKEACRWKDGDEQKRIDEKMLPWKYVTAYLQGLIDRSEILGTNLRGKVNFLMNNVPKEYCVLERNMESDNWIEDKSKPLFREYLNDVNSKTKVGDLIMIADVNFGLATSREERCWFMGCHGLPDTRERCEAPSTDCFYTVEKILNGGEGELSGRTYYMRRSETYYKILYYETNEVWGRDDGYFDTHMRKRRTGFWLNKSEFCNLSRVDEKELEFYITDRRYREDYLREIPVMKVALKMLRDIKNGTAAGNKGKARW